MLRSHVILAVFKRNVASYFSGVLGYLFIVVFVVASSFFAFNARFFTNNLANLDQLSQAFPLLLLFIVPAITMTAWAEEKKQGTDELLFTLPARDIEIVLGKYLAVAAVYSIVLFFSLSQLAVLGYFADPDWGLLLTTYFGYWLAGVSLLSAGMFASALTGSATVAFVLGAVICAVPVFIGNLDTSNRLLQELSLSEQLREFSLGVIPFSGVLYFVSLAVFMLYLNMVCVSRRHWSSGREGSGMGYQFAVRALSLAVVLISLNAVARQTGAVVDLRFDMTEQQLFSLSDTTHELIDNIDKDQPVLIQAFISPEVPRELVVHQNRLYGLLRQYDQFGGNRIEVRFVEVEPFSEEAEEARLLGITPQTVPTQVDGRISQQTVFLGAVVSSSYDEVVIPFFETGVPVEYELTRSIRTVSNEQRLTVGILRTDANVTGGFNMQSFSSMPEWRIKQELDKQYKTEEVSPDAPIDQSRYDVLIAVLPSSLTDPQLRNLVDYVKAGKPVLIFDDPLTYFDNGNSSPTQPKPRAGGGMMGGGPPPEQKAEGGRTTSLLAALGIDWSWSVPRSSSASGPQPDILWDQTGEALHPEFGDYLREQPEFVFVSPASGTRTAFNPDSEITSGLRELMAIFPGAIRPRKDSRLEFEPLLRSGVDSGLVSFGDVTRPGFFGQGIMINPRPPRFVDEYAHTLAAHIQGGSGEGKGINVVYVADVDLIADFLFSAVQRELHGLQLDNVKFVLNAVDVLSGDLSYVDLRKRRTTNRALTKVQQRTDEFRDVRTREQERAEKEAEEQLEKAQERLTAQVEKIRNESGLSAIEQRQKMELAQETEQRKLDVAKANIEQEKNEKIEQIKAQEQRQIRELVWWFRFWTVAIPPIPALLLGVIVLSTRLATERRDISSTRRVSN